MASPLPPTVYPLFSVVSWGSNAVAGRFLALSGLDGLTLSLARFLLATPLLLAAAYLSSGLRLPRGISTMALLVVAGATGIAGFNYFFYSSLELVDAATTAFIASLATPLTYTASVLLGYERLTVRGASGIAASIAGLYLLLGPTLEGGNVLGPLLAFGAALSWTIYTLIVKRLVGVLGPLEMLAWASAAGTLMLLVAGWRGLLEAAPHLTPLQWLTIVYVAVVPGFLGYLTWNYGVERIGPAKSAVFIPGVPLTATILGAVLLGEILTPLEALGGLLIVVGIYVVVRS